VVKKGNLDFFHLGMYIKTSIITSIIFPLLTGRGQKTNKENYKWQMACAHKNKA
jgi:hypothetical protein